MKRSELKTDLPQGIVNNRSIARENKKFIMNRYITVKFFSICLIYFSTLSTVQAYEQAQLIGNWAMIPLKNGVANVATFDDQGNTTLYPFECDFKNKTFKAEPKREGRYVLSNDLIKISLGTQPTINLKIIKLTNTEMILQESLDGSSLSALNLHDIKVKEIQPLCANH